MSRDRMSLGLPGAKGTTYRTGLSGYFAVCSFLAFSFDAALTATTDTAIATPAPTCIVRFIASSFGCRTCPTPRPADDGASIVVVACCSTLLVSGHLVTHHSSLITRYSPLTAGGTHPRCARYCLSVTTSTMAGLPQASAFSSADL